MKVSAIICEYNPFHNGHKYQIDTARSLTGCDAVVALMSGNFVQRGDFAIFPKAVRADAAILGGIDLVLENPAQFVLRSAEGYASAAVYSLSSLGCVDYLIFGAECDDLNLLKKIAELLAFEDKRFKSLLSKALSHGSSFASARGYAIEHILGSYAANVLKQPNNLLAIEYLKAIIRQNSPLEAVLIKRVGAEHNSVKASENIASASHIRDEFLNGNTSSLSYTPSFLAELYKKSPHFSKTAADKAIISALCLMKKDNIASAPDISEGLHNKIKAEAMKAASLDSLITAVKSKRYAYSRIQRAILCAYLGITAEDNKTNPLYLKILNFNPVGQRVLNTAKKTASLPLAKNASAILNNKDALHLWQRELEYDSVYKLFSK